MQKLIDTALAAIAAEAAPVPQPPEEAVLERARRMVAAGYQPYDRAAFEALATWLAGPRTRGLLLCGRAGCGKTHLFAAVLRSVRLMPAGDVVAAYHEAQRLLHPSAAFWYSVLGTYDGEQGRVLCLDDLGSEPVGIVFGQREEVLAKVVCDRYRAWQCDHRVLTHYTTNLTPDELDVRYGRRVTDRLREMCVKIDFTGSSNRAAGSSSVPGFARPVPCEAPPTPGGRRRGPSEVCPKARQAVV